MKRDTLDHVSRHLQNLRMRPRTVAWRQVPNVRKRVDDKRRELEEARAVREAGTWWEDAR